MFFSLFLSPTVGDVCEGSFERIKEVSVWNSTKKEHRVRVSLCCADFFFLQIRISYIDLLSTTTERQQQLNEQYYFTCTCSLCQDRLQVGATFVSQSVSSRLACVFLRAKKGNETPCNMCSGSSFISPNLHDRIASVFPRKR